MAEVKLTKAQQAVVDDRGGALLVSAAAGSGKTKVLVDRLLSMILDESDPKNIDDFLMITYTKAAAAELRGKILAAMQEKLAQLPGNRHLQRQLTRIYLADISTVHAFCANILRENAYRLDIPADFRMMEELESRAMRQRVMDQTILAAYEQPDGQFMAFAETLGSGRDDRSLGEITQTIYEKAQSHRDPAAWLEACAKQFSFDPDKDYGETVWGGILLADLHLFLEDAVGELEKACALMAGEESLEKAYLPVFTANAEQLRQLRSCESWEAVHTFGMPDFGRLKAVRNCGAPEVKETAQFIRKQCADDLKKKLRVFKLTSEEAAEETKTIAPAIRGALSLAAEFGRRYEKEKRRRHAMDFSDLEHETIRLLYGGSLNQPTAVAREISDRYHEILVDEYQDSNEVQDAIFRAISKGERNLFMVGDVKQSIYRFRLADPGIFLQKYKEFAPYTEAEEGKPRKILLSENFRSRAQILHAVNDVFRRSMSERTGELNYGDEEALRAGMPYPPVQHPIVELHCIQNDLEGQEDSRDPDKTELEAAFVARRLAALLRLGLKITDKGEERPLRPDDIAILLRSPRSAAAAYVEALQAVGISCVSDTGEDILKTTELQVLTSLLEVVENPHQDIPLLAVLAGPLYGFTASELASVRKDGHRCDFFDSLRNCEEEKAQRFLRELEGFRRVAETDGLMAVFDRILQETDALAVFGAMKGGAVRRNNVQVLRGLIVTHTENGGDLVSFVRSLQDLRETGVPLPAGEISGAVTLTSIHKSKGLEYPVVVLAGLSKAFNMDDLRQPVLVHPDVGAISNVTDVKLRMRYPSAAKQAVSALLRQEMISEELRVLYVGMTRARELLIMTYCSDYMKTKLSRLVHLRNCATGAQLSAQVASEGDWILAEALGRTEAGELHALCGKPMDTAVSEEPWMIRLHSGQEILRQPPLPYEQKAETAAEIMPDAAELVRMLDYRYPGLAASELPSKLTATQLKGRRVDEEVREHTPTVRRIRQRPGFLQKEMTAAETGTATHLAMQFLRYEACASAEGIEAELDRLVREEFLTQAQRDAVDARKILRFFSSETGRRVLNAPQLRREFKFSVLMDAKELGGAAAEGKILLQGVTDCCIVEEDGITVLDFKTDHISAGGEAQRAEYYRGQLEGYASALQRILQKPVREKILYFFETDTAISI